MGGCDFRKERQQNPEIKSFTRGHSLMTLNPLNPRDAFYGGRTGNTWKYYEARHGEKLNTLTCAPSIHMSVNMENSPLATRKCLLVLSVKKLDLCNTDGLIKCKILPPQSPCGDVMTPEERNHIIENRVLEGTCG